MYGSLAGLIVRKRQTNRLMQTANPIAPPSVAFEAINALNQEPGDHNFGLCTI